jgi:hypothetical protein
MRSFVPISRKKKLSPGSPVDVETVSSALVTYGKLMIHTTGALKERNDNDFDALLHWLSETLLPVFPCDQPVIVHAPPHYRIRWPVPLTRPLSS